MKYGELKLNIMNHQKSNRSWKKSMKSNWELKNPEFLDKIRPELMKSRNPSQIRSELKKSATPGENPAEFKISYAKWTVNCPSLVIDDKNGFMLNVQK